MGAMMEDDGRRHRHPPVVPQFVRELFPSLPDVSGVKVPSPTKTTMTTMTTKPDTQSEGALCALLGSHSSGDLQTKAQGVAA